MRSVIRQTITLPASAVELFDMYLDPDAHAAITGHVVTIGAENGAPFHAFDGQISGHTIATVKHRIILQSWRSVNFKAEDPDATLLLSFDTAGNEGQIDLVHIDVPDHEIESVTEGWHTNYWKPWRTFLEKR